MLGFDDDPTIRHAILKRLDKEPGAMICEIKIKKHKDHIAVGVLAQLDGTLITRSVFDLPPAFYLSHLHNEIDQIAEQFKAARRDFTGKGGFARRASSPETILAGTGRRGLWRQ